MRFLFTCLSSRGFVNPAIGIAKMLAARGHDILFASDASLETQLSEQDLPLSPPAQTSHVNGFDVSFWADPLHVAFQVKHIEAVAEQFTPDVIVGHALGLAALVAGERLQIPVGVVGLATYLWPTAESRLASSEDRRRKQGRQSAMLRHFNTIRSLFSLPEIGLDSERPLLGNLFLLRTVEALEGAVSNFPEQVHMVGACLWETDIVDPELEAWLDAACDADEVVIYVQPGRLFDRPHFWPSLLTALEGLPARVALTSDRMDCDVGPVSAKVFSRPHIQQGRVLKKASAAVLTANTTATLGALVAGVPILLVPGGGEQPDIAERCESAGIARVIQPQDASCDRLADELRIVLEDRLMRSAAKRMAERFALIDGRSTAATLLEHLASSQGAGHGRREPIAACI
jgi:UDP:flavonoid glycosyltransferase YjiC (YdhE family)